MLTFNGTEPKDIKFGKTELDRVICNKQVVWRRKWTWTASQNTAMPYSVKAVAAYKGVYICEDAGWSYDLSFNMGARIGVDYAIGFSRTKSVNIEIGEDSEYFTSGTDSSGTPLKTTVLATGGWYVQKTDNSIVEYSSNVPLSMSWSGNILTITCTLNFNGINFAFIKPFSCETTFTGKCTRYYT